MSSYQKALQSLWGGLCDVFVREQVFNPANGRTELTEVLRLENEACRLSFGSKPTTTPMNGAAALTQTTKIFMSKDIEIPPGSKFVVSQNGVTSTYAQSGQAAIYKYHQEITVELFKGWA